MVPLTSSLCSCPPAPRHPVPLCAGRGVAHTGTHPQLEDVQLCTSPAVPHQSHLILGHRARSGHRKLSRVGGGISWPNSSLAQTNGMKPVESSYSWEHPWQEPGFRAGQAPSRVSPRVKAARPGCAVVAPACSVPLGRASATPKSRSLWLARRQDCPCATRWQLLFRDLSL